MSLRKVIFWLSACLLLCPVVTVDVHGGDVCPCFSEQELKARIRIIREIAAAEGGITAEDIEVSIRLNEDDEFAARFEVKANPDEGALEDTFTSASVGRSTTTIFNCAADIFILDMQPEPQSDDDNIDSGEAQACLAEMLAAFAKEQK